MVTSALAIPVLWKDSDGACIQGTVDVHESELPVCSVGGAKVKHLIQLLNDKFQDEAATSHGTRVRRVDSLLLYGTRLSHDRLLSSVIVALSAYCPRLVAATRVSRRHVQIVNIFVQPPNGSLLCLLCALDETIGDVKLKLQDRTGIRRADQHLTFEGRPLHGQHTLADYNAYSECTLHLALRLRGGFTTESAKRFADVSNDSLIGVRAFSRDAPQWRTAGGGLNLEGWCETRSCAAYGKWVIQQNGYNSFNLTRDGSIKCPLCARDVKPLTCLLTGCVWKYEGVRTSDRSLISSTWKDPIGDHEYHRFDVDEIHGLVAWESLLIIVASRETAQAAKLSMDAPTTRLTHRDETCSVCWSPSTSHKRFKTIACGHSVHGACMNEWAAWCQRGRVLLSCPVCRLDLSSNAETPRLA